MKLKKKAIKNRKIEIKRKGTKYDIKINQILRDEIENKIQLRKDKKEINSN